MAIYDWPTLDSSRKGGIDMSHLIDLEHVAKHIDNSNSDKEIVLDILYEHACELRLTCLIEAIELYWQSDADKLEAQRQLVREKDND